MTLGAVHVDILHGSGGNHHINRGWVITRVAVITGLAALTTGGLLQGAEAALTANGLVMGSPCPDVDVPTYLEEFMPEVVTKKQVRIRLKYRGYQRLKISFNSSIESVDTNLEGDTDPQTTIIRVAYQFPSNYLLDPSLAGKTIGQGGMVSKNLPALTATISGTITTGGNFALINYLALLVGKVNLGTYVVGGISGADGTWLCNQQSSISLDGMIQTGQVRGRYDFSITFAYRKEGWDPFVVFIDPRTGKPPADMQQSTTPDTARTYNVPADPDNPTIHPAYSAKGYYRAKVPLRAAFPTISETDN